jgi:hypothetical protein
MQIKKREARRRFILWFAFRERWAFLVVISALLLDFVNRSKTPVLTMFGNSSKEGPGHYATKKQPCKRRYAGNESINFLKSRRSIPEKFGLKNARKARQIYRTIL